jgi:hypothetical protein
MTDEGVYRNEWCTHQNVATFAHNHIPPVLEVVDSKFQVPSSLAPVALPRTTHSLLETTAWSCAVASFEVWLASLSWSCYREESGSKRARLFTRPDTTHGTLILQRATANAQLPLQGQGNHVVWPARHLVLRRYLSTAMDALCRGIAIPSAHGCAAGVHPRVSHCGHAVL